MKLKIYLLLLPFILVSCDFIENQKTENQAKDLPENFDYGRVKGNSYYQKYLGLELIFDTTWAVQSQEQIEKIQSSGAEMFEDEDLQKVLKATEVKIANLFAAFKYEIGSAVEFNPSIMIVAENLSQTPGIKKGKDYLFHAKKLLEKAKVEYEIEDDFLERSISDKSFDVMKVQLATADFSLTQEYLVLVKRGFCLMFIISYSNEEDKNELYSFLDNTVI